ncbi:MAG TPA: hypothetical protein PKD52_02915 [Clostridiales bacterium]|nr:hypothetical protein [Clostridiales bacterium]
MKEDNKEDLAIHGVPVCPREADIQQEAADFRTIPSCAAWAETQKAKKTAAADKERIFIHGAPFCPGKPGQARGAEPQEVSSCAACVKTQTAEMESEVKAKEEAAVHGVASCAFLRMNRKIKKSRYEEIE